MTETDFQGAIVEVIEPLTRVTTVQHTVGIPPQVTEPAPVQRYVVRRATAQTMSGHRVVTTDDAGLLVYADHDDMTQLNRRLFLLENAWSAGDLATAVASGPSYESSWSWDPNRAIFLGSEGQLTQTPPSTGYLRKVAAVAEVHGIWFDPQPAIVLT